MNIYGRRNVKIIIFVILFIFVTVFSYAQSASTSVTGTIDYLEGYVDVHRDGDLLDWTMVDIGFDIEQFDLVETGDDGYVELSISTPSSSGNIVRVSNNTAFYLDFEETGGRQETRFEMLSGSIALKIQKVAGKGEVTVKTESAVMGVRGTEFTVTAAPEGSILVTCETGSVSCSGDSGRELYAEPGNAVEKPRDGGLKDLPFDIADFDQFRKQWVEQKIEDFVPNSSIVMTAFVQQYMDFSDRFDSAYDDIMRHGPVFKRWERDIDAGRSVSSAVTDKIQVSPAIFKMRSTLPMYERLYYRIKALNSLYNNYGLPNARIKAGYSLDDFFREFDGKSRELAWKLSQVRYIYKLYAKMEWSLSDEMDFSGGESLMDGIFDGNNPFGGDLSF